MPTCTSCFCLLLYPFVTRWISLIVENCFQEISGQIVEPVKETLVSSMYPQDSACGQKGRVKA